jgi:hypothetical protein
VEIVGGSVYLAPVLSEVIVTGAFTLGAALTGVALTQRHAMREAHRARAESRRGEQRRALSELLLAGRRKVENSSTLLLALHVANGHELRQVGESASAEEARRTNYDLSRALVEASLLVGDRQILVAIVAIRQLNLDFPDKAFAPVINKALGYEGFEQAMRHVTAMSAALNDLEDAAGLLLRTPLAPPDPWPRRAWRWLSGQAQQMRWRR